MSKPISFKERFKGQIQSMGKGGIRGTQTEDPIKSNSSVEQQSVLIQPQINTFNGIV